MKETKSRKRRFGNSATLGWIPLQMAEFPLVMLADSLPTEQRTLEFVDEIFDKSKRKRVNRRVIVTAADKWGLPNWKDMDVLLALLKLTIAKHGFRERTVRFSFYELRKLLRWPDDGRSKSRLRLALLRLCGMTIAYERSWRRDNRWASIAAFHPLDEIALTNTREGFDAESEQLFKWSDVIVESMDGVKREFDWDFYLSLKRPAAKRLYLFLLKRFHLQPKWEFDLAPFCQNKLGMLKYPSNRTRRYKDALWPAISELQERGFIRPQTKDKVYTRVRKNCFQVAFHQAPKSRSKPASAVTATPESELTSRLRTLGVRNIAAELVRDFPAEKIRKAIANFEDRKANGEKLGVGYLVNDIRSEEGFAFRPGYLSEEEQVRRRSEELARRREADKRREQQATRAEAVRQRKLAVIASWTNERRVAFDEEAKRQDSFRLDLYRTALRDGNAASAERHLEMIRLSYFDKLVRNGDASMAHAKSSEEVATESQ